MPSMIDYHPCHTKYGFHAGEFQHSSLDHDKIPDLVAVSFDLGVLGLGSCHHLMSRVACMIRMHA